MRLNKIKKIDKFVPFQILCMKMQHAIVIIVIFFGFSRKNYDIL
jgi:hypothetical protein